MPVATGPTTEPRAAWVIRAGEYLAEREICRSDQAIPCVVPATVDGEPASAVVSVYLYPAGMEETSYQGAFMAGFMGSGGSPHETKVDYRIRPGESPRYVSSIGRVTAPPGNYEFRMALLAGVPGHVDPHQFQQTIAVRVVRGL